MTDPRFTGAYRRAVARSRSGRISRESGLALVEDAQRWERAYEGARDELARSAYWLDHVLAAGRLHPEKTCSVCDLIRVRPTRAFTSPAEHEEHLRKLALPVPP